MADLPLIAQVSLSSTPHDVRRIVAALIDKGILTVKRVCEVLGAKHPETARKQMEYVQALGLARFEETGVGQAASLSLSPEWSWCASDEFRTLLGWKPVTGEGVCAPTQPATDQGVCDPDPGEPVTGEGLCDPDEPVIGEGLCDDSVRLSDDEFLRLLITKNLVERQEEKEREEEVAEAHNPLGVTG